MRSQRPEPGAAERQQLDTQTNRWGDEVLARSKADMPAPKDLPGKGEYAVQQVHHDYLVCRLVSGGVAYGSSVNVAKDPALRRSLLHDRQIDFLRYVYTGVQARTVEKMVVQGFGYIVEETKNQIIIPKYLTPADEQVLPTGGLAFPGSIITAEPSLTLVQDDGGGPLYCQLLEITQRAYANDEEAT
ncbi:MAG: hypothetical protein AAGI37_06965 [Planctomycetota bacterium]